MLNVDAPALMDTISKLARSANTMQSTSLIQYTGSTRITPLTIVDTSLLSQPELQDILQVAASLYSGYYLMGMQYTVNSIDGVSVVRQLDKLRPTRDVGGHFGNATSKVMGHLARENFMYRLPMGDEPLKPLVYPSSLGTESADGKPVKQYHTSSPGGVLATEAKPGKDDKKDNTPPTPAYDYGSKTLETINQDTNLAVGKMLELKVTIGQQKMSIPVNLRLNTFNASPKAIVDIVANVDPHKSGNEVKALYQAGIINLWDAITAKSAVNEWRKAAIEDKTGIILREDERRRGNRLSAALSGEISVGDISGIYVISEQTASTVEGTIGGRLSDFRVREKLLAKTGVMLLVVVDPQWKRVTIYHHSIDSKSTYSFADLKRGGKSNNHDIGMVLDAFRQGQAPAKFF